MRKLAATLLLSGLACTTPAHAAPVARFADLTLTISILGLAPITLSATRASVMMDSSGGLGGAGQITIPAGALSLPSYISIPVTASTAFLAVTAQTISNQRGVFSIGGAGANIPPTEFPCPPARAEIACVQQTGLGGIMGLSGTIGVVVAPGVAFPIPLASALIGRGGFHRSGFTFIFDGAPWTVKTGAVAYTSTSYSSSSYASPATVVTFATPGTAILTTTITVTQMGTGSASGSSFTLVSPTYVAVLGNVLPIFSSLEVRLVPEPGAPKLLGSVLAALALAARLRRQQGSSGRLSRGSAARL